MAIESTISRANLELQNGRLWRAKEILASSIVTYGYSKALYLAYANVLIKSGDELNAGMYYLLSVEEADQLQMSAIDLFLARNRNVDWRQLLSRFPKAAQLTNLDEYPAYLRSYLLTLNAPHELHKKQATSSVRHIALHWMLSGGCFFAIVGTAVCAIVGAYTIFCWMFDRA